MIPSSIFAPCPTCGIFPGARHGYKCLCHQQPGDPAYAQALAAGVVVFRHACETCDRNYESTDGRSGDCPDCATDYAEQDEAGQLSIGIQGEQRSFPGLAKTYPQEG